AIAFLTTPFKFLGISGWKETGCPAEGRGRPVRDAQHSTDGFWTIDVLLEDLTIGAAPADLSSARYLRLEVEPDTAAHEICAANPSGPAADLRSRGSLCIDPRGPFLALHPGLYFRPIPSMQPVP